MQPVRYSEDVKDILHLLEKFAKKQQQTLRVADYLQALIMSRRTFNRLDRLFHTLQVPIAPLKKVVAQPNKANQTLDLNSVLEQSQRLSQEASGSSQVKPTVDVEHLIKALYQLGNKETQSLLEHFNLTPSRIDTAVQQVNAKQTRNNLLFLGKEMLEVVTFVLVFLILIKSFLGELRLIPSESMLPGLQINDRLVIERVSRWTRPYQRGDILVFYPPMSQLKNDPISLFLRWTGFSGLIYKKDDYIDVAYIKRLIGLPGDRVDVRPGDGVYVNGKKLEEPYVNEVAQTCTLMKPEPYCGEVKVPPDKYFLMGDNRNQSLDSRYWGFAEQDRIIGRAVFRIWPLNRFGVLPGAPYEIKK